MSQDASLILEPGCPPRPEAEGAARGPTKSCLRCGAAFGCGGGAGPCWCEARPRLGTPPSEWSGCYCPDCLDAETRRLAAEAEGRAR